ncbi:MAG: PEP-CTERM sorting domain-containing protein [Planctomycetales bacterium]
MNRRQTSLGAISILVCALWLGAHSTASAAHLFIANPGFEDPATTGFNVGSIAGWSITGSGGGVWNINDAPLGFWTVPAPEGKQIGFVARESPPGTPASISQVLADVLQDFSTYKLTGQVGHPLGFGASPDPDTEYTVELLAGSTTLASLSATGPEGQFVPFELIFDSTGSNFVGQALQIRLSSSKSQSGFDDLQLEVVGAAVPEPSMLAMAVSGAVALLLARRRTAGNCRPV